MRTILAALLLAAAARGHGESGRNQPPPSSGGTQVFPAGGPTVTPRDGRGNPATTVAESVSESDWQTWWAYNAERVLAVRTRGATLTGLALPDARRPLRELLYETVAGALEDKSHSVRASAAIVLGKFGLPQANALLQRHIRYPGEGWFDVRDSSIYGMGILGLADNRGVMRTLAGDKEESVRARGMALVSLATDGTDESRDLLLWHLRFRDSDRGGEPAAPPQTAEEERRRMAAHLLGFSGGAESDAALEGFARDSDRAGPAVQALSLTALARRRVAGAADLCFRLADARSADREVRRSAVIGLGQVVARSDEHQIGRLARLVREARSDHVAQQFAVMSLAQIGGPHALGALKELLGDNVLNNERDRAFLYLALGLCGSDAGDALLGAYERARTAGDRAVLALSCALARVNAAQPLTLDHLGKSSLDGGAAMLEFGALAVGLHGDLSGAAALREILRRYNDAKVRRGAAMGLALLLKSSAAPELVAMLREEGTAYTRAACVSGLGLLADPPAEVVDALVDAYRRDSNPDTLRAMAVIALGALADPRPVPLSAALTSHYNYFVRCLALDEIARYL